MEQEQLIEEFRPLTLIERILIEHNLADPGAIEEARHRQAQGEGSITQILIREKKLDEKKLLKTLGVILDLPVLDEVPVDDVDLDLVRKLPISYAKQHLVLPLYLQDNELVVVTANPLESEPIDHLSVMYGNRVRLVLATSEQIIEGINRVYDRISGLEGTAGEVLQDEDLGSLSREIEETTKDVLEMMDEAPVIRLVNQVLVQAVKEHASDIHVEPYEQDVVIRFRKDGVLHEVLRLPKRLHAAIASRIKIMGNLNIAEKRLPQDGRIRRVVAGKEIDIRLSTVPTSFGERLVMRILDRSSTVLDLAELGLEPEDFKVVDDLIHRPHGIILVTGPTGSGKTTTLYAALTRINTPDKNILTIEDPVEYQIDGIGQMQVNPKIDFTFASGLRASLRQDPDVILVGEIRDRETAEIAVQASLTGHLVFSTLHTNDAASAFTRLIDMGVEPFLIASSVLAVIAQRLVRKVCPVCRRPYEPTEGELRALGIEKRMPQDVFYKAVGCDECLGTGYSGRIAIYEILVVDEVIRELIMKRADASTIKRVAMERGMHTLRQDGIRKFRKGITTAEEVMRVTQGDES